MRHSLAILALLINSCNSVERESASEQKHQVVCNEYVCGRLAKKLTRRQYCHQFYNNGQHKAWAKCMGVGYK